VYVIAPRPSSSAMSLLAVRTWSSAAVPVIVTDPVGASLTFATDVVAELATLSAAPKPSV
jgi:hypothetical protein